MPRRPGANSVSNHREIDPLISNYQHEKQRPREAEALEKLKKIASLVKPLMRARNWRVGTLTEFYPNEQNLLGKSDGNYCGIFGPNSAYRFEQKPRPRNPTAPSICRRRQSVHAHGTSRGHDAA